MRRAALALALMLLACPAAAEERGTPGDAALDFAAAFADDHLSGMLSRIGGGSEALRQLSLIHAALVATTFDAEIDAAVERHREAWTRNLAAAWEPLLSPAEMRSIATDGATSPHAGKFAEHRDEAAAAMADSSGELFRAILDEVMGNTMDALTGAARPTEGG